MTNGAAEVVAERFAVAGELFEAVTAAGAGEVTKDLV